MLVKGNTYQDDFSILICARKAMVPIFVKETLLKLKSHSKPHKLTVGILNTLLLVINRLSREVMKLTHIMNEMDFTNIYIVFHPNTKEYTFFSALHGSFSKIDHRVGHKAASTYTRKLKQCLVSYQTTMD